MSENKLYKTLHPDFSLLKGEDFECPEELCFCNYSFYINEKLAAHNAFISVGYSPIFEDEDEDEDYFHLHQIIELQFKNISTVYGFCLYNGSPLPKLLEQSLLLPIFNSFLNLPFDDFREFIKDLSEGDFITSELTKRAAKKVIERFDVTMAYLSDCVTLATQN